MKVLQPRKLLTTTLLTLFTGTLMGCQSRTLPSAFQFNSQRSLFQTQFRVQNKGLTQVKDFGSNPGNLDMWQYTPANLKPGAPLVVALHGCTQTPQNYDDETGWTQWAQEMGFSLLLPGQKKSNNQYACFNWGGDPNTSQSNMDACDTQRDCGEAKSIKEMVDKISEENKVDPARIFITGLSAGAAYANVMLAAYPDVFAGGGLIAGIPYQCNRNSSGRLDSTQAFMCMSMGRKQSPQTWAEQLKKHNGFNESANLKWPSVQIWHGERDFTVRPQNTTELMKQWTGVHGIDQQAENKRDEKGYTYQAYANDKGQIKVETFFVKGMGHGVPIDQDGSGGVACGKKGSFIKETHICSSYQMAKRWKLDQSTQALRALHLTRNLTRKFR